MSLRSSLLFALTLLTCESRGEVNQAHLAFNQLPYQAESTKN